MVVFNNRMILQQKVNGTRGGGSRSDEVKSQTRRVQQNISMPARGASGDKFKIEIFRETEVDQGSDMPLEGYVSDYCDGTQRPF